MTIADLMRHTAGYSYDNSGSAQYDAAFKKLRVIERDIPGDEFQSKLADLPLLFQPGTDWHYGISTDVLGRVVEVVSGLSLAEFFQTRIFAPLGMVDTGFSVPANQVSRFAANYNTDGQGKLTLLDAPQSSRYLETPAFASGGGGLVSTASDYMRFLMMIEAGGTFAGVRLLNPETVALMTINQVPPQVGWIKFGNEVRTGVGFGFGFSVREQSSDWDPDGRLGEYGWGGAASTHYWVSPKDRLIVITLEQVMPYQWLTELMLKGVIYDAIEAPR
jgi:CubicO group peptidase (beta-lactamase class C family)